MATTPKPFSITIWSSNPPVTVLNSKRAAQGRPFCIPQEMKAAEVSGGCFDPKKFGDTRAKSKLLQLEPLHVAQSSVGFVQFLFVDIVRDRLDMALEHGFKQSAELQPFFCQAHTH